MNRKAAIGILGIALVAVLLLIIWKIAAVEKESAALSSDDISGEQVHEEETLTISWHGTEYHYRDDLEAVLFIGLNEADGDAGADESTNINYAEADCIMLVLLDHSRKTLNILQLNRDTICAVPLLDTRGNEYGTEEEQLALAHTSGTGGKDSCRNVVNAVSDLLYGISIDHYVRISIDSVSDLNDAVGGVTVTLEDDFSFVDPQMTAGTTLTLTGEQAELFVQSRQNMEDPTNIARMGRQKVYTEAWLERVNGLLLEADEQTADTITDVLLEISDDLTSDMSVYALADLIENGTAYTLESVMAPDGEAVVENGIMAFYPDEEKLQETVVNLFFEES